MSSSAKAPTQHASPPSSPRNRGTGSEQATKGRNDDTRSRKAKQHLGTALSFMVTPPRGKGTKLGSQDTTSKTATTKNQKASSLSPVRQRTLLLTPKSKSPRTPKPKSPRTNKSPNSAGSQPKAGDSSRLHEGWGKFSDAMLGLVPPGILMHTAQRHAGETEARTQERAQESRERHKVKVGSEIEVVKKDAERPDLFSGERVSETVDPPASAFARSLLIQLVNFHMWWSYLLLVMLIYHPLSTILAVVYGVFVATAIFAVYDLIWTFVQGHDLKALSKRYFDFAMKQWVNFKNGEGRKRVLIVLGIVMNSKNQQQARSEATRRAKRAKQSRAVRQ